MSFVSDSRGVGARVEVGGADVGDFVALLKPRVMSLVVFTALVGMTIAPGGLLHPVLAAVSLLAVAVGAGASGALNMWWDADVDRVMTRTRGRPVPSGRVAPGEAAAFGAVLSAASVLVLGFASNWLAAGLLAFTIFFYVVIYTMWLKRRTPQNIVVGGAAGAFPPMIGWAAVTGSIGVESLVLFLIIFLWTPPHFWALALLKSEDYARAGVPMLPVAAGPDRTRREILVYTALYLPATLLPSLLGFAGPLYAATATALAVLFAVCAWRVQRLREGEAAERAAKQLFAFSILQLLLIFAVLLAEHAFGAPSLVAART
jgi:protoheme IX farnesyltransferase